MKSSRRKCGAFWTRGYALTHLDTHKHTHLAPPVLQAVARIAEEFGIPWVRRPFDLPITAARVGRDVAQAGDQRRAGPGSRLGFSGR